MFIKSSISRELEDCDVQLEKLKDGETKTRIRSCLQWFTEEAVKNRYYFYILSIISFSGPILINILMVFSGERLIIKLLFSIVSGCAAIAAYLLQLLDVRTKWRIYRIQAEMIKREVALFEPNNPCCEHDLLIKVEEAMGQAQEEWVRSFDDRN